MKKKYLIGTSGYNYDHWKNKFYPEDLPKKDWFRHYSSHFNTVEINYSFYRWPDEKTLNRWHEQSPAGFTYSLKAPRFMTHLKKLKEMDRDIERLYHLGSILEEKMGCFLFQLPPNLHFNNANFEKIRHFSALLDGRKKNVIEFRHASWWNGEVFDLLEENKTCFCNVSGLEMPDDIITTARIVYFRFHGKDYSTKYSENELGQFADAMKNMKEKEIYSYFNNDKNAFAVENARELKEMTGRSETRK